MQPPGKTVFTLKQAIDCAAQAVKQAMPTRFWVVAEVASISNKGHVYLELVEKEGLGGNVIAKTRGMIWSSSASSILGSFSEVAGLDLAAGMSAMMLVTCDLHAVYGLGLVIHAVSGEFTLGEMAKQKRDVIDRLDKERLLHRNRSLPFPIVAQRIAIISSATAAGYDDFVHQLATNPGGYRFRHRLFEALLQGDQSERSLTEAIMLVRAESTQFDIVVVIRGGGSKIDLNCFDSYAVAAALAGLPIPAVTGIGHERDESVADMVAHTRCKTPTAAAELIIATAQRFETELIEIQARIAWATAASVKTTRALTNNLAVRLHRSAAEYVRLKDRELSAQASNLIAALRLHLEKERGQLDRVADKVVLLDPINVLRRGYSLVYVGGRILRSTTQASVGGSISVRLADGAIDATVAGIHTEQEEINRVV